MDFISAGECVSWFGRERWGEGKRRHHTSVQLCLRILHDIASDARLVRAILDLVLQRLQQTVHVHITPVLELDRLVALTWEESQQRHIVLPVIACRSKVANAALHVDNLLQ